MDLPRKITQVLRLFEEAFSERVWEWAKVLLIGAILAPGERTVTATLCVMGLSQEQHFQDYHRVLNRAKWSGRALSRIFETIQNQVPEFFHIRNAFYIEQDKAVYPAPGFEWFLFPTVL